MSKLIECPDCLGIGGKAHRTKHGITFKLKEPCPTCLGTGKAFVKGRNMYIGRPDLSEPPK